MPTVDTYRIFFTCQMKHVVLVLLLAYAADGHGGCLKASMKELTGLPFIDVHDCDTSYSLGFAVGRLTSSMITARLASSKGVQECIKFAERAPQTFLNMQKLHTAKFLNYMVELQGLADGAQVPYDQVS